MPSFLPNAPATTDLDVPNGAWWPAVTTAVFRQQYRVPDSYPDEQVLRALQESILAVNAQLSAWQAEQIAAGHASLAAVPADTYGEQSALELRYLGAVRGLAKARLMDQRRDTDSTGDGHDRADALENSADDYRAESTRHIRALLGQSGTTVELI